MNESNGKSSDAIKADIERTRNDMSDRIDTLQERLNPDTLKQQAQVMVQDLVQESADALMNFVSNGAQQAGRSTMEMIKRNPLPAAVVGAGIGWMILNMIKSQRGDSQNYNRGYAGDRYSMGDPMRSQSGMGAGMSGYGYDDRNVGGYGSNAWDKTTIYYSDDTMNDQYRGHGGQGMMDKMRSGAQDTASRVGDTAQGVAGKVQDTAQDVAGRVQDTAQGIAGKVQDTAQGIAGKVQDTAQNIAGKVQDTAGKVQDTAGNMGQPIGDMSHQARHQAMDAGRQVSRQASNLTAQTQHQAQRMGMQAQRTMEDNPIAFGAAALIAGIAVGLALPATRQERQLLGDVRDQVMDKAQTMATGIAEDLKQVANDAKPRLQETAQRVTDDLKQSSMQATQDVKETLQDATNTAKSRVGEHLSAMGSEGQQQSDIQSTGEMDSQAGSQSSSKSSKSKKSGNKSGSTSGEFQSDSATLGTRQMSDYTSDWQSGQEHHPDDVDSEMFEDDAEPDIVSGTIADTTSDDREE